MPTIAVIAGSNRAEAQSHRIAEIAVKMLGEIGATTDLISLRDVTIPEWHESKWAKDKPADSPWLTDWAPISDRLRAADGFVVISPEWHGMVPPGLKNLLICCDGGELAFKPGYLIAVAAGVGGAYPIVELRISGYKNSYLHWLPDHMIIRNVGGFHPYDAAANTAPDYLAPRMRHGLEILSAYAEAATAIRADVVKLDVLKNGM